MTVARAFYFTLLPGLRMPSRARLAAALLPIFSGFACSSKPSADTSATRTPPSSTAAGSTMAQAPIKPESALAPEVNPPGDIPDTQAFVSYASTAGGYSFDVPEGWARTEAGPNVSFVSKLDGVRLDLTTASAAPTAATARAREAKQIESQARAVTITAVSDVSLPAGKAVVIKYTSNSDPNSVTQKQVRLENEAYLYYKNGKLARLTLWAPQGADNVDQWSRMSKSFRWK